MSSNNSTVALFILEAILGFTVPQKCEPMWLLGLLVDQLGLKLVSRKKVGRGQQVTYYSLSKEELDFARAVIAHRAIKRAEKEERARTAALSQQRYQTALQFQFGVAPPNTPVSTPPIMV